MAKNVQHLVVDTTAFLQNAQLQNVGQNIVTCQEVVNEITSKRQLRRLVVLPYDLIIKNVDPDNVKVIIEFSKKTGDYQSLSATDIKVMALTYQLEKEHVGVDHLLTEPVIPKSINVITTKNKSFVVEDIVGFYNPNKKLIPVQPEKPEESSTNVEKENKTNLDQLDKKLNEKFQTLNFDDLKLLESDNVDDILIPVKDDDDDDDDDDEVTSESSSDDESDGDDEGWICPSNVQAAKKHINSELVEDKAVKVACMTTDFAMQNVLKQMKLNVAALDGRMIKQLRTFILRCYACFKTTSIMTKEFCPNCGNKTLKRVAVSLDETGKQQIHINARRPLTNRGKKFSLPRIKGGKHSNNPHLVEDQPFPDQRVSKLARKKNNPMDDDYIAGYSPFVMHDVVSKSAQLHIKPSSEIKHWMKRNPNEPNRRRK